VAIDAAQFRGRDDADPKAGVVVVFDQAALDADRWRSLPARTVGDCDGPRTALAAGQESALAELAPFLDHADLALWQVHRAALKAGLPKYRAELAPYRAPRERNEGEGEDAWQRQTCGHAYAKLVDTVGRCLGSADPCPWAPRVLLHGGAFIASVEPDVHVPEGCATVMGRDYAAELRRMAAEAGEVVAAKLDPGWTVLSHRFGTITEVFEALEDVCAPRRRRFADTDLAALRTRLREIGEDLAADELADPDPRWEVGPDIRHVPGLGAVHVSMRYEPGEGSLAGRVVQQARGLRELGLDRARCRSSERTPWVALVVDATNATVPFYGYFYEEELACDDLPPAAEADSDSAPAP
jgi:hypothetical protein